MDKMEKIEKAFESLTRRFGAYPLKEGQALGAIKTTWAASVGGYNMKDIYTAITGYTSTSKFNTWPSEGELMAMLRDMGARPEAGQHHDNRPENIKKASWTFSVWYNQMLDNPTVKGEAIGHGLFADVLGKVVRAGEPVSRGKSFEALGCASVLRGDLPDNWDVMATAVMAGFDERKKGYHDMVASKGLRYTNENWRS